MTLPYRLSLICLLLTGITFGLSPWWAMQSISQAAKANNNAQWQHLVKLEGFNDYADKMLSGLLKLKMYSESNQNSAIAMRNYQERMNGVPKAVQELTAPQGFNHLLCGELLNDSRVKPVGMNDCWSLDGKLTWESPVRVKVTFNNPETLLQSSLILSRVGLFTWQAVGMELPVKSLIERFAKSIGLKKMSS